MQSFIIVGNDENKNLEKAFDLAIDHMSKETSMELELIKKHVQSNTYPNFLMVKKSDDANEIQVDDSRRIIEFLLQRPAIAGNCAVIVHSAELMSKNAANALLKILEDPPDTAILILTTKKLMSLLPTIRSRCVQIRTATEHINVSDCENFIDYANKVFGKEDNKLKLIRQVFEFIQGGMKNIKEFSQALESSDLETFCEICFIYSYFKFCQTCQLSMAEIVLKMQEILAISKRTYPDKQSLITAVWCVFKNFFC
ncbi:MAG: hypothetical protein LBE97_01535 [Holosporales bacterium]|nr:hypothetical protein [Holosporales bacterium]